MLHEIVLRELVDHLRSLRFSLTFLLVTVLMLTGSVLYIHDYRQLVADYSENVNENLRLLKDRAKENFFYRLVSWETQGMFQIPEKISLHFLLTDLFLSLRRITDSNFIIYPLAQNPLAKNCQHIFETCRERHVSNSREN